MTKKEEKLIVGTLSELMIQAVDMDCPKKYLNWSIKKEKDLISELGLEAEWDKAVSAKGSEVLRKKVEEEATGPISKAIGMMLVEILASMGDDDEEDDE